jgi:hypothetical protein
MNLRDTSRLRRLGFLAISVALIVCADINAAPPEYVLNFESLVQGDLEGQGGWLPPIGESEFEVVQSTSSGAYVGGQAIRPNGRREALIDDSEFPWPVSEAIASFKFNPPSNYPVDQPISVHFDALFTGRQSIWIWLSEGSEPSSNQSPAYGIGTAGSFTHRYNYRRSYRDAYEDNIHVEPGNWLRLYMTLDPLDQTVVFSQDNLTTGEIDKRTIHGNRKPRSLAIDGNPRFDPAKWDRINIGWRNGDVLVDNITVPFPVPEPGSAFLFASALFAIPHRNCRRPPGRSTPPAFPAR